MLSDKSKATGGVLIEVLRERQAQDKKWGEQNHPMIGGGDLRHTGIARGAYADQAESFKQINAVYEREKIMGWDTILLEEVTEAMAESDPAKIRAELVQVAAVAVAMIESLDRNELAKKAE
jgi:hypothetical protein